MSSRLARFNSHTSKSKKQRLDHELVARGMFQSVDEAERAILSGEVYTTNRLLTSPGEQVSQNIYLATKSRKTYVSRGGLKLKGGLDYFGLTCSGKHCLDVGCSTGGFTDCLLQEGAAHVVAVDVGYAQFSWDLRNNPLVRLHERTNVTDLVSLYPASSFDLIVCDVSFTSIAHIFSAIFTLLTDNGHFLGLVKPQFEAKQADVGTGGVVRDIAVRKAVIKKVQSQLEDFGMLVEGCCASPLVGHKGNIEYLMCARKPRRGYEDFSGSQFESS